MSDSAILAEVGRRKQRAREFGLVELVFRLYFDVKDYGERSKRFPDEVHPDFWEAVELEPSDSTLDRETKGVVLLIDGKRFVFLFKLHQSYDPDENDLYGTLSLTVEGQEVFSVTCCGKYDQYVGLEWRPSNIEGFIEGVWIESLRAVSAKIFAWNDARSQECARQLEATRLENLKKKFGL